MPGIFINFFNSSFIDGTFQKESDDKEQKSLLSNEIRNSPERDFILFRFWKYPPIQAMADMTGFTRIFRKPFFCKLLMFFQYFNSLFIEALEQS